VAGDEVYGGRQLHRSIRERGIGYVLAVRANHSVAVGSGRAVTVAAAALMIPARAWHRRRTGSGTKGTRHYDWAMLEAASDVLLARRRRLPAAVVLPGAGHPGRSPCRG
jgi:hypothetical protein